MSRSFRRTPIIGMCATARTSEKRDKQFWHREFRRAQKRAIHRGDEIMPHFREIADVYSFVKDGKAWIGAGGWWRSHVKKAMRK
jgi:coproporphyrinogen III oxidase